MELNNLMEREKLIDTGIGGVELFTLVIILIYFVFSFVLTRRIRIMNLNLKTPYSKGFIVLSWIHTLASLAAALMVLSCLSIW